MSDLFKVGDKIKCIEAHEPQLELNKFYIVRGLRDIALWPFEIFVEGNDYSWMQKRFEPAYIAKFKDKLEDLINE